MVINAKRGSEAPSETSDNMNESAIGEAHDEELSSYGCVSNGLRM